MYHKFFRLIDELLDEYSPTVSRDETPIVYQPAQDRTFQPWAYPPMPDMKWVYIPPSDLPSHLAPKYSWLPLKLCPTPTWIVSLGDLHSPQTITAASKKGIRGKIRVLEYKLSIHISRQIKIHFLIHFCIAGLRKSDKSRINN